MSANADLITVETHVQGKRLKTSFSYMGQNVKKLYIFGYLSGPGGGFNDQTGPILLSSYPPAHIYVHVKQGSIRTSEKNFLSSNPIYEKK